MKFIFIKKLTLKLENLSFGLVNFDESVPREMEGENEKCVKENNYFPELCERRNKH